MDDLKLSLCITTYNRTGLLFECFEKVFDDPRIDEIIIYDDCSKPELFTTVLNWVVKCNQHNDKIKLYRHAKNVGMSLNKYYSILRAKNEWCILFDSDNILGTDYIDAFYRYVTKEDGGCPLLYDKRHFNTIFCPDFAKPDFNYTYYSNLSPGIYGALEAKIRIKEPPFNCLMNTCNYIVNRQKYLNTYCYNVNHIASDTIWHNYNHLKSGGIFAIVPDMQYFHRVHKESGFMQNIDYNIKQTEQVRKLIAAL